jgi:FMN phosphatase YigB (HAD superfamily)
MIKAILLDMDNTLIQNPDTAFAYAFLALLDRFGKQHFDIAEFATIYRRALWKRPAQPDLTIWQALTQGIANQTAHDTDTISDGLHTFYQDQYPELESCITPQPGAWQFIQNLQDSDYRLVIATNPLYAASGTYQRLAWGQLPQDGYDFVTHAENVHFTKPQPAYFAEVLARIGLEPDEVVIFGDSEKNDIAPGQTLRTHTAFFDQTDPEASFQKFLHQLESLEVTESIRERLHPAMIEPQYRGNIAAMFGLIQDIQPHYWYQHPDPDEWSPIQILCHLSQSEINVQRARLERILNEDNPFLAQPKPPPRPDQFNCLLQDGLQVAHQWAADRAETLNMLDTLSPEQWRRPANHSIFGPTTLLEMAQFTAQHDRLHLEQLCQTIGNCA